mmetsp:Transcript_95851/g.243652  ORF Transcript_95851/g.243652 Transcript_95851/m.243652 type:complete len:321 (-) Transcript_95851:287-1249(-)
MTCLAERSDGTDRAPVKLYGGTDAVAARAKYDERALPVVSHRLRVLAIELDPGACAGGRQGERRDVGAAAALGRRQFRRALERGGLLAGQRVGVPVLEPALTEGRVVQRVLVGRQHVRAEGLHIVLVADVGEVEVVRLRGELGGQGVHLLDTGPDVVLVADIQDVGPGAAAGQSLGDLAVAETELLGTEHQRGAHRVRLEAAQATDRPHVRAHRVDGIQLSEEPLVDVRQGVDIADGHALLEGVRDGPEADRVGHAEVLLDRGTALHAHGGAVRGAGAQVPVLFEASGALVHHAHGLLQGFGEGTADGHDLTDRLHLRAQ